MAGEKDIVLEVFFEVDGVENIEYFVGGGGIVTLETEVDEVNASLISTLLTI